MDISGSLKIKLALGGVDVNIDAAGAYKMNEDATTKTHSMILTFKKVSYIEEVRADSYDSKHEKFANSEIFKSVLENTDQVTHVVTYIEYGSELNIELEYTGEYNFVFEIYFNT